MKTLLETSDFTLVHDQSNQWLYIRWEGLQPTQSILAACDLILQYVRQTGSPKLLSDSTEDEDGWAKLVEWLAEDFFQQLADNGVEAIAWVLPTNLRARTDVQRVVDSITRPLTDVFDDTESAYTWLRRLPGKP